MSEGNGPLRDGGRTYTEDEIARKVVVGVAVSAGLFALALVLAAAVIWGAMR